MNGRLVNIKRFSVHDGPGIRTTVFLKGCPLSCRWCHNPESISCKPEVGFFKRKCLGCAKCTEVCPAGAHIVQNGTHEIRHDLCTGCGKCAEACLADALEFYGQEISVDKTAKAVLEDKTFYAESGGGCTFSGGEPLLQADFCAEVFKLLKQQGIHCAIDTSGSVKWEMFEKVLPYTDIFLYDLKHTDDILHQEQVGASNKLIIDNLKRLSNCSIPIEIRIPLIPGFNADEQSVTAIGKLLAGLRNITGVKLLPYHLAHSKYEKVGRKNTMPEVPLSNPKQIQVATDLLTSLDLK